MDQCFIEFPNYNLYICYDDVFCYINFVISKYDNLYNFIQFVYQKNHMYYGIKQVIKFKNKDSLMYKVVNDLIDDILNDPIDHDSFYFILLPSLSVDNTHLDIYLCRSNSYYDTFIDGVSLHRSKIKVLLVQNIY